MTRFHVNGNLVDSVDLLRKRHWRLRLRFKSWPVAITYATWMIFIAPTLNFFESSLVLGGLLVVLTLVYLFTLWSVDFKCFVFYSKVNDIDYASACKITPAKFGGSKKIVPLHKLAGSLIEEEIFFNFQNRCFIYSHEKNTFFKLSNPFKETFGYYFNNTGYTSKADIRVSTKKWGQNVFEYPEPTILKLTLEFCVEVFFVYQFVWVGLMCLDGYLYYYLITLFLMFVIESMMVKSRLDTFLNLRWYRVDPPMMLMAYRCGKWKKVAGRDLVPGDVVSIGPVDRKEMYLPADMLILAGTAIVNETILTGESSPQWKVSIMGREPEEHLYGKRDKKHILFCGTKILHYTSDMTFHMKTPDGGCLAIVLRTGCKTTYGKLMRTIFFSTEKVISNSWENGLSILLYVLVAVMAAGCIFEKGLELPTQLLFAVNASLYGLRRRDVYSSEPVRILFAGKVDICCFDKTGTLTSDDMEFSGVCGLSDNTDLETNAKNVPTRTLEILASCHTLVFVDNKLVGDPLEKAAFKWIDRSYKSDNKTMPNAGGGSRSNVHIVQRFHFASHLRRMAVVVRTKDQFYAFVKGAPETIQERLNHIPEFYTSAYQRYTRQGSRLVALAYKHLPDMTESEVRNMDREVTESGLTFTGFAVFDCPIREDSATILSELKKSSHDLAMMTGDQALTACHVAREVNIISQPVLILVLSDRKQEYEWVSPDETEILSYSEEMVESLAEGHDLCIGGDCFEMLQQTCAFVKVVPYVKVFARVAPDQKEVLIITFNSLGKITLMCGDGANDIRALKQAHVGVVLPNKRRLPADEKQGSGSIGDTSPFSAKYASVSSTTDIVRQGRSVLVTTLQILKILGLNCLSTVYDLCVIYLHHGVKLGKGQSSISGLFTTLFFISILDYCPPLPTLSSQRPHSNVLCLNFLLSILGQFALHMLFLNLSVKEAKKHMPDISIKPDSEFESNIVNTVSYVVSIMIQVMMFVVNYHPCNQSISESKSFKLVLLSAVVFCTLITSDVFRGLNDLLMLVPLPRGLREKLLIWAACMFFGCYTWERFLMWTFPG